MKNLAMTIFEQMEKALNIEAMEMRELFEDGIQSMRMNYYPSCPQPDKVIGLTPHSDAVGLSILLQVNEVEGLQIRKDGMWLPVKPLPNAFILNIGDILEVLCLFTSQFIYIMCYRYDSKSACITKGLLLLMAYKK